MTTVNDVIEGAFLFKQALPEPLRRELDPPDAFPMDALGDVLAPAARVIQSVIRAPDAISGQSALATANLAVQAHANVVIDGRTLPLSENFISVGASGVRKSAADQAGLAPVAKRQKALLELHEVEKHPNFDIESAVWNKDRGEALKLKDKAQRQRALEDLGPAPTPPPFPLLTTEEPTYEGLIKLLDVGWPSVSLSSAEGGRFLGGYAMNDEHRIKTMAGLNALWDGSPITRTRGGEGSSVLYGRRLSVNLMVQPMIAEKLFSNRMAQDQGFLSRCLVSSPTSTLGEQQYVELDYTEDPAYRRYFARMMGILEVDLPWNSDSFDSRGVSPRPILLDPDAKRIWVQFHDWIQAHLKADGVLRPISGIAAKAAEHALRLAGTLALVDDLEVSHIAQRYMEAGIALATFYLSEALRLFDSAGINPDLVLAQQLLDWTKQRYSPDSENSSGRSTRPVLLYPVLIYQHGPNAVRDKTTAKRVIGILEDHGWLCQVDGGDIVDEKHRKEVWAVNPALWEAS